MNMRTGIGAAVLAAGLLLTGSPAEATPIFHVTINTLPLAGLDVALDLQLIEGDGVQNNAVTLSAFDFGSGGASGVPTLVGGAAGTVATAVTLSDTDFFNAFVQPFVAGAVLSFDLMFTTNSVPGAFFPDRFTLAILDANGAEIPTLGFADEFLGIDFMPPFSIERYGTDPAETNIDIAPPLVQPVPEPAGWLLVGSALFSAWYRAASGRGGDRRQPNR
jgi:hypothetical protein